MKQSGIYLITNQINKKVYVGQSIDVFGRIRTHKSILKRQICGRENIHLLRSVKKYGFGNFSFEVLLLCSVDRLTLNEQMAKDYFEKTVGVYNQVGPVDSPCLGRKVSEETKDKIRGKNNPNFGRNGNKHPMFGLRGNLSPIFGDKNPNKRLDIRIKKREANRIRFKAIERIDMITGEIKEYESISSAVREGFRKSSIISCCKQYLENKFLSHSNFWWKYL